ncbi:hypothetical protein BB561_002823, partial [Smittium simulii]
MNVEPKETILEFQISTISMPIYNSALREHIDAPAQPNNQYFDSEKILELIEPEEQKLIHIKTDRKDILSYPRGINDSQNAWLTISSADAPAYAAKVA